MDKASLRARVQNVTYSSPSMKRNDGVLSMPVVHNNKMARRIFGNTIDDDCNL